jgi:DNA-binding transcriptional ArsR family regulator
MDKLETNVPAIEIKNWPGLAICSALCLVPAVDELPGIGDEFELLARSLELPVARSILIFLLTNMHSVLPAMSLEAQTTDLDPEAFVDWVDGLDAISLAARARQEATNDDWHEAVQSPQSAGAESPTDWLREKAYAAQLAEAQSLLENPASLKRLAVEVLRAFWYDRFQRVYAHHLDSIHRVVGILRQHEDLSNLQSLLERLLSRSLPGLDEKIYGQNHALLVPLPFMGPYLSTTVMETPVPMAILAFDAARALRMLEPIGEDLDVSRLKALADETRLKILQFVAESERFGGEIVTHLGISQPGVSRHLRLLVASGLLHVRQEGTTKYYSIYDAQLETVARGIQGLKRSEKHIMKDGTQ